MLALPLLEYARETVPYVKLHRMCDAAELLARFAAAVLLADLLRMGKGRFPRKKNEISTLETVLADNLTTPTFGSWRVILEEAVKALPKGKKGTSCFVAGMPAFASALINELGTNTDKAHERLIACRNCAAHSGRMPDAKARALLKAHRERFEGLFKRCALLGDYPLVARGSKTALVKLMGTTIPASLMVLSKGTVTKAKPGRLYLLSPGEKDLLDLSPLHTYLPVRLRAASDSESPKRAEKKEESPVPQVYFRAVRDLAYLEYLTFTNDAAHGHDADEALKQFKELFKLDEWREEIERGRKAQAARQKFAFRHQRRDLLAGFIGRGECLEEMARALEAKQEGGIVWMTGKAGSGKSALMAKFLELGKEGIRQDDKWVTVFHFFRAQEGPTCSRSAFLENALGRLIPACRISETIEDEPKAREDQFSRVLGELARTETGRDKRPRSEKEGRKAKPPFRRGILFFLDGLDELLASDPAFPEFIQKHQQAGVVWFCAGQSLDDLQKAFPPSKRCLHVFPPDKKSKKPDKREGGVPRMTRNEVYEYLTTECPSAGYEFMRRDATKPVKERETGRWIYPNPFLDTLITKSQGLPLYLYWVAQDVREGRRTFRKGEEQRLPAGLRDYYNELLKRMSIGDLKAVMTPIVMRLAVAKGPLTIEALRIFLAGVPELKGEKGKKLLKEAIVAGHAMLRRASLPLREGEKTPRLGYTIYHDSFKEHLLSPKTTVVERTREVARDEIEKVCIGWKALKDSPDALEYCLRFSSEHFIASRRWKELERLLTDLKFIEAKCAAGMAHELSGDYTAALDTVPEGADERQKRDARRKRLKKYAEDLAALSRKEIDSLDVVPSVRPRTDEEIETDSLRIAKNPTRLNRIKAFARFVNSESHVLARFASLQGFCLQHAYNCADSGPVGDTARGLANSEAGKVLLLHAPQQRLKCNPHPALLRTFEVDTLGVWSVSSPPDGSLAISGSHDRTLRIWELDTGRCLHTLKGREILGTSIGVTADGKRATWVDIRQVLWVWDLDSGRCLKSQYTRLEARSGVIHPVGLTATPDGTRAIWGGERHALLVWDLESGRCIRRLEGHTGLVAAVDVTPDGRRAVSGSWDQTVCMWDIAEGRRLCILKGHARPVTSVSVTPDGRRAASGSEDRSIRVWDLESERCLHTLEGHSGTITDVDVTPDGRLAISCSDDWQLRLWDLDNGRCLRRLSGHINKVKSISLRADGWLAVSGSSDGTVRVWDLEGGRCRHPAEGHTNTVFAVRVTPDSKLAVSGSCDETLRVWDLESGRCLRKIEGHTGRVDTVSLMADGKRAVSGSHDKTLRVWDLENGRCIRRLGGHTGPVTAVDVTSDGKRAISGSRDQTVCVWDIDGGHRLCTLEGHTAAVAGVKVTPDDRAASRFLEKFV